MPRIVRVRQRDELQAFLKNREVGTEIYYPVPMHVQQCFAYLGQKVGDFPSSEAAAKETLALPIYPELAEGQLRYVVDCIRQFATGENLNLEAAQIASSGSFKQSN